MEMAGASGETTSTTNDHSERHEHKLLNSGFHDVMLDHMLHSA